MTPEEIKEILDKSGYLFEQKVASLIENLGFTVTTNRAYLDPEENKSREIDVLAFKRFFEIDTPISAAGICYLNCECKNSSTPYVFINRKRATEHRYWKPDGMHFIYNEYSVQYSEMKQRIIHAFAYFRLEKEFFGTKGNISSVQVCKIIRNGNKTEAQHTGIIEGFIYPLLKSRKHWEEVTPQSTLDRRYCKLFFNLVIVNSELYTIDSEAHDALPVRANFVPFIREIRNKDFQGNFLITFVQYGYLQEFIQKEIEGFCRVVYDKYLSRPELMLNDSIQEV